MECNNSILVTGASGSIGSRVCLELLAHGKKVVGMVRDVHKLPYELLDNSLFRAVELEMDSYDEAAAVVGECIDAAIHLAWEWRGEAFSNWRNQLCSVSATCVLLEQAAALGARRFVFCGTYNELEASDSVARAQVCPRPTTVYSTAKLAADMLLRTAGSCLGVDVMTAMPCMVYGSGGQGSLAEALIGALSHGESPRLIPENVPYDFIYSGDAARALVAIAERGKPGSSYYVGHSEPGTIGSWARDFRDAISPGTPLRFGEYPYTGGVDFSAVDTERLERDTGFRCEADVTESARETAAWMLEQEKRS